LEAGAQGDGGKLMRVGGEHGRFYVIHGEGG
jgi:hypothetical protein